MEYKSNAKEVVDAILIKIKSLDKNGSQSDKILRTIASTITGKMIRRIHQEGRASDGTKIGTYTPAYMKVRTGRGYKNADLKTKGKNKGKEANSGFFTKGKNAIYDIETKRAVKHKNSLRKSYNRTDDTTVILALTNQMQNDMNVCVENPIQTSNGFAIGYQNEFNYQKAMWLQEDTYKKKIFDLTTEEAQLAEDIAKQMTDDFLK